MFRTLRRGALALFPVAITALGLAPARGGFDASVSATVTPEAGGLFLYSYTVTTSPSSTLATSEFIVDIGVTADLTAITAPSGFDAFYSAGDPIIDFQSFSSSTDIGIGQSGSFSFTSTVNPGLLGDVLRNLDDTGGTFTDLAGTTLAPAPEPSSLALCGIGGTALWLAARRRRRAARIAAVRPS